MEQQLFSKRFSELRHEAEPYLQHLDSLIETMTADSLTFEEQEEIQETITTIHEQYEHLKYDTGYKLQTLASPRESPLKLLQAQLKPYAEMHSPYESAVESAKSLYEIAKNMKASVVTNKKIQF